MPRLAIRAPCPVFATPRGPRRQRVPGAPWAGCVAGVVGRKGGNHEPRPAFSPSRPCPTPTISFTVPPHAPIVRVHPKLAHSRGLSPPVNSTHLYGGTP